MTRDDIAARNLSLGFEFDKYLVEHPELLERIPENAVLALLPQDDPELAEANLAIAQRGREPGQPVVHVIIRALDPLPRSRVLDAEVSTIAS